MKKLSFITALCCMFLHTKAQVILDMKDYISVILSDGTSVTLYGAEKSKFSTAPNKNYYYLPCNLRLNTRNNKPTFLLQSYLDNNGKVNGAILGAEFIWGLTKEQMDNLNSILKKDYNNAVCKGPAYVRTPNESGYAKVGIVSASMNQNNIFSSPVVTTAGEPSYVAGNLSFEMAQVFDEVMRNKKTTVGDLTAFMGFTYYAKMTGVTATITVDWQRLYQKIQTDFGSNEEIREQDYFGCCIPDGTTQTGNNKTLTSFYLDELREQNIVQIRIDNNKALGGALPENFNVEDIFLNLFQTMIAKQVDEALASVPKRERDTSVQKRLDKEEDNLLYLSTIYVNTKSFKKDSITLSYDQAVPLTHYVAANIKQWYNNQIKSCDGCVPEPIRINTVSDLTKEGSVGIGSVLSELIDTKLVDQVTVTVKSPALPVAKTYAFNKDSKFPQKYQFAYLKKGDDKITYGLQIKLRGNSTYPVNAKQLTKDELTPLFDVSDIGLTKYEINVTNPNVADLMSQNVYMVLVQLRYKQFGAYKELSIPVLLNDAVPLVLNKEVLVDMSENSNPIAYRLTYFRKGGSPILATDFAVLNSVVEINIPPALVNNNEAEITAMQETYKKDPGNASETAKPVPEAAVSELEKLLKQ